MRYCKSTIFQANHNAQRLRTILNTVVCDTAKVRFFKQITTNIQGVTNWQKLFAILQKYDFSSKSQHNIVNAACTISCLRYCKSTIFQANHNSIVVVWDGTRVVCDTAKVRFFKQITTLRAASRSTRVLFAILQKYDFSSKSQRAVGSCRMRLRCLRYCKSTIFQANHNPFGRNYFLSQVVCDTAKVRFFKQITTYYWTRGVSPPLFAILQKYDFSSKSQPAIRHISYPPSCLRYCKSTIFQANHNKTTKAFIAYEVVCDTAKVRFFKQITTRIAADTTLVQLFAILQKYDFSSKSQPYTHCRPFEIVVCDTAKVRFFKQITTRHYLTE